MKTLIRSAAGAVREQLDAWGITPRRAAPGRLPTQRVGVYLVSSASQPIGYLFQRDEQFVFRYSESFKALPHPLPISAFPDIEREYHSERLWPFFAVRLPPTDREDVRRALAEKMISEDETLRMLTELSRRVVSSPYELRLA